MTNFLFAVGVWIKAVVINIVLIAIFLIFKRNFEGLPFLFLLFIIAALFTAPLLIIITQVVRISNCIPYTVQAKFAWLSFMLMLTGLFFYLFIGLLFNKSVYDYQSEFGLSHIATLISILCAAILSKKSFKSLSK